MELAHQTAHLLDTQNSLNVMSGGDLTTHYLEYKESELPLISINTGGNNRLSYPQVDYSRNPTENPMFFSPYLVDDSVEEFMPLDIFQKIIMETENMIHKNNEDALEYKQAMLNIKFHNKRVAKPVHNRNFKIYTGPQACY